MHDHHSHPVPEKSQTGERKTVQVIILTFAMMVIEIAVGLQSRSMALLADGFHMGTHVMALGIAVFAYVYARRHANDPRFRSGTHKVSVLGGFTSAIVLAIIALFMGVESIGRFFSPQIIHFNEAIWVAAIGLVVNIASVFLLSEGADHHHDHGDGHHHRDHNLRGAYLHVLADALTSVLAIFALSVGKLWGWVWMDAVMGIVGALVISKWSYGLIKETGGILLDRD